LGLAALSFVLDYALATLIDDRLSSWRYAMGYGNQILILDFVQFTLGKLVGERTIITPDHKHPLEPVHDSHDGRDELVFVSFDAESPTSQYTGYGNGLAHVLNHPSPQVEGPVRVGRESTKGDRGFDYTHETRADRVIAVVGFPPGLSANNFDPWPTDAKRVQDRLVVKFDLLMPETVHLRWEMLELGAGRSLDAEVGRIKRHETGANSEKTLVLFIHGLGGSGEETWDKFPQFLRQDEEFARKYEIAFFSYPTMLVRTIFSRKAPSIQELAAGLRTQIENRYAEFPSVVLVCHSLGGLIARKYLLDEFKAKRQTRVKGIVLFAVPNNGADLAGVANVISWRHRQVRQLCRGSDLIELLNEDWYTMGLPKVVRAKYVTGTQDRVVDRFSARATWGNPDVDTVIGKGHRDIVTPERANDDVVIILKRFLKTLANVHTAEATESKAERGARSEVASPVGLEAILNAQNQPVFEAHVQGSVNDAGICDRDRIVVRNAGAPISQVKVTRLSLFSARYYDMRHAPISRVIPTLGYYNGSFMTGNALGEVYMTEDTRHRLRMHKLLDLSRKTPVNGYTVLVDFRHYLQIAYNDRSDQRHTRSMEVSEMGYTGLSDAEWNGTQQAASTSEYFDFDANSDEAFLQLLKSLPTKEKSQHSLPGVFSLEQLGKTMSNPRYADDILRLDRTYHKYSVVNRETIIIVVGTIIVAELLDRPAAELLRDHIDERGGKYPFRRGIVITDDGWYNPSEASAIANSPVIAIGGPKINKLAAEFDQWKPNPPSTEGTYPIPVTGARIGTGFFRKNPVGLPQVGLWGDNANATRETVEHFLKNENGFAEFLKMCWK
jgi:pimeloyl-ACP methyl ester carboxylesterase